MKIAIHGIGGAMGQSLVKASSQFNMTVLFGIDPKVHNQSATVFKDFSDIPEQLIENLDAIIDFSTASAVPNLLHFCTQKKLPLVLCTTGISEALQTEIQSTSQFIPIFQSGNMSYGINVVQRILELVTPLLTPTFDIEVIERHHKRKVDAPSGTALMLANTIMQGTDDTFIQNGRFGNDSKRHEKEIGMHAVRGGTIIGEHEILFAGEQETIRILHQAQSRDVFAHGALKAASYISKRQPGLYAMHDLIQEELHARL